MIDVVVVDDDGDVAEAFKDLCASSEDLHFAGWAANTSEGLTLIRHTDPDIVLADIRMPGAGGVALTRTLAAAGRDSRPGVIVLTSFALDDYLLAALAAGASAFLPKSTSWADIASTIRAVNQGEAILPPTLTRRLLDLVMPPGGNNAKLTPREIQVLNLVGNAQTNEQIAEHCVVSVGTVRTHLQHLRAKLGVTKRTELVVAARRYGLGYAGHEQPEE